MEDHCRIYLKVKITEMYGHFSTSWSNRSICLFLSGRSYSKSFEWRFTVLSIMTRLSWFVQKTVYHCHDRLRIIFKRLSKLKMFLRCWLCVRCWTLCQQTGKNKCNCWRTCARWNQLDKKTVYFLGLSTSWNIPK